MTTSQRISLYTEDRQQLEHLEQKAGRVFKLLVFAVVTGDIMVVGILFYLFGFGLPTWLSLVYCALSVVFLKYFSKLNSLGSAAPSAILNGSPVVATSTVTVVDRHGDAPFPWSLQTDMDDQYYHMPVPDSTWKVEPGQRYVMHGFGSGRKPFKGVVMLTQLDAGTSKRHWVLGRPSHSPRYVAPIE